MQQAKSTHIVREFGLACPECKDGEVPRRQMRRLRGLMLPIYQCVCCKKVYFMQIRDGVKMVHLRVTPEQLVERTVMGVRVFNATGLRSAG